MNAVEAKAWLLETARSYAFGAAREEDLTAAAVDFAQAEREEHARTVETEITGLEDASGEIRQVASATVTKAGIRR